MSPDEFFTGLTLDDQLPLAWRVLSAMPDAGWMTGLNTDNEAVLRSLALFDDHAGEYSEDAHGNVQEYARLEHKLNLVLDMIGQMLVSQGGLPPAVACRFDTHGIEWQGLACPPADTPVEISIYLSSRYPRPLRLVALAAPGSQPPVDACRLRFTGLSAPVIDRLESHIFRHHRRRIAHSRAAAKPTP